jgi:DNA-binding NtrC family response regulator
MEMVMIDDTRADGPLQNDPQLALVIDDDAQMRDFIGAALRELGLTVGGYISAKQALASIDICHPAIIFLDVALLGSDAIDVIRGLSERGFGGVVQLMSGGRPSLLEAIGRIGVRHRLRLAPPLNKPFPRDAVAQVVASLRSPDAYPVPDRNAIAVATAISR